MQAPSVEPINVFLDHLFELVPSFLGAHWFVDLGFENPVGMSTSFGPACSGGFKWSWLHGRGLEGVEDICWSAPREPVASAVGEAP